MYNEISFEGQKEEIHEKNEDIEADDENSEINKIIKIKSREDSEDEQKRNVHHFTSLEMTKEQRILNELERIKLNELKKCEIEKWEDLLKYIKFNLNQGKLNSEEILNNIYQFL